MDQTTNEVGAYLVNLEGSVSTLSHYNLTEAAPPGRNNPLAKDLWK